MAHKNHTCAVHRLLEDGGYPAHDLAAVVVELASAEQINQAGGRERFILG